MSAGEFSKIAFVGTSCVGKTTLLDMCREKLVPTPLFSAEAAREYFTLHPLVTERFSAQTQGEVQALAFKNEQQAQGFALRRMGRMSVILCDRSVLDAPVYVSSQGDIKGAEILLEKARPWIPTYSKIFLLNPSDIAYQTDAIRTEDETTRQLFHDTFTSFFMDHSIAFDLLSGTLDERFDQVNSFISQQRAL